MLCSSRGGFSSGKEGGKKVKVNKRKCAEESEQVACRAARQALLAGVSVHGLKYQFPLSGSSRLPQPRHSLGFRRLMPAEAERWPVSQHQWLYFVV